MATASQTSLISKLFSAVYVTPDHLNDTTAAVIYQHYLKKFFKALNPTGNPGLDERTSNVYLIAVLENVVAFHEGEHFRGVLNESAEDIVTICTNANLAAMRALDCTYYSWTVPQAQVREFRIAAGTIEETSSQPSSSTSGTSRSVSGDGIIRPDIVVYSSFQVPPSKRQEGNLIVDDARTSCVTLVGENEVTDVELPEGTARKGLAQLLLQLASAQEAFGTFLGTVMVNSRYTRLVAIAPGMFAIEANEPHASGPYSAQDLLCSGGVYQLLKYDARDDFAPLWDIVVLAVRILGAQPLYEPLRKLKYDFSELALMDTATCDIAWDADDDLLLGASAATYADQGNDYVSVIGELGFKVVLLPTSDMERIFEGVRGSLSSYSN